MRANRPTLETVHARENMAPILLRWIVAVLLATGIGILILLAGLIT